MPNGIQEVTDLQKPVNPPTEFSSKNLANGGAVEQVSARRIHENYPTPVPDTTPETKQEVKEEPAPEEKPVDIGKIPGVKEVYVKPTMTKIGEQRPAAFIDPSTGKPLDFSMRRFLQETMNGGMINRLIRRFDLEGIDLEKEFELVQKKESRLSASRRKAVVALYNMRQQQKQLLADIGKELLKKGSPTDDELRALLDSVEDANTNQTEAAAAVAQDIAQRALAEKLTNPPKPEEEHKPVEEKKEEVPAAVQKAMEDAKVDYTPGEGGNDEVTTKALHDAVKNHGRTKFRGVFSSLDLVEDPQVGDIVHTIVTDDKGNHTGEEAVYTYVGPNHWALDGWKLEGSVHVDLPEEPTHRFRGVFSDYREVEDPQVGDICHVIVASKRPENIQYEDVFKYDGNKWVFIDHVEASIPPENDEKEPVKEEDGSITLTIG